MIEWLIGLIIEWLIYDSFVHAGSEMRDNPAELCGTQDDHKMNMR